MDDGSDGRDWDLNLANIKSGTIISSEFKIASALAPDGKPWFRIVQNLQDVLDSAELTAEEETLP